MNSGSDDCYFWINELIPEDVRVMNVMCVPCHEKSSKQGWFWQGSVKGYGPYEYKCDVCGKVIHPAPDKT